MATPNKSVPQTSTSKHADEGKAPTYNAAFFRVAGFEAQNSKASGLSSRPCQKTWAHPHVVTGDVLFDCGVYIE